MGATPLTAPDDRPLVISVEGLTADGGEVLCLLYESSETWLAKDKHIATATAVPSEGTASCVFPSMPAGTYAVLVTLDLNGDGRLNRGMFGLPQEPWGVSNQSSRRMRPAFDSVAFEHPAAEPPVATIRHTADLAVFPGAFYSQETSLGFSVLGTMSIPLRGTGAATWPSSVVFAVVGTTKKQFSLALWPSLYLGRANDWMIEGEVIAEHFPTRFYGIGPVSEPTYQDFSRRRVQGSAGFLRRIFGQLYLGALYEVEACQVLDIGPEMNPDGSDLPVPTGETLLGDGVTGEDRSVISGPAVTIRWDSRDNPESARRGVLIDLELAGFPGFLGASHPFARFRLDARTYLPFADTGTIATQILLEARFGDPPFTSMAEMGGDHLLRGLYQGRFRDRSLIAGQVEIRSPEIWRFRLVGFVGLGQVFGDMEVRSAMQAAPVMSAGGGLRFEFDPISHTCVRLDLAGGPHGFGVTFTAGEAF